MNLLMILFMICIFVTIFGGFDINIEDFAGKVGEKSPKNTPYFLYKSQEPLKIELVISFEQS